MCSAVFTLNSNHMCIWDLQKYGVVVYNIFVCLHTKRAYKNKGSKTFSTKTSGDIGMVNCVSDATGSWMEKRGGKGPGTSAEHLS